MRGSNNGIDWRDIEDVATHLRVSRATVFRLISEGQLARIRHGRGTVVPQASLDAYVKRQEERAFAEAESRRAARSGEPPGNEAPQ